MAYVLTVQEHGGFYVKDTMKAWYNGVGSQGLLKLSITTGLGISVRRPDETYEEYKGEQPMLLSQDDEVVLHTEEDDVVRFKIDLRMDGNLRVIFFHTGIDGVNQRTSVIKPIRRARMVG